MTLSFATSAVWVHRMLSKAAVCSCLGTGVFANCALREPGVMRGICSWNALPLLVSEPRFSQLIAQCSGVMARRLWFKDQQLFSGDRIACLDMVSCH